MLYIIIALAACILDQITKLFVTMHISLGSSVDFIPGIIDLTYVRNTGAAFSMLSEHTWFLMLVSLIAIIAIIIVLFKCKFTTAEKICLALILGGAAGNAIDRMMLGYVVDMIEFTFVNFAIFNVADIFINVGGIMFCVFYVFGTGKKDLQASKKSGPMPEMERLRKNLQSGGLEQSADSDTKSTGEDFEATPEACSTGVPESTGTDTENIDTDDKECIDVNKNGEDTRSEG